MNINTSLLNSKTIKEALEKYPGVQFIGLHRDGTEVFPQEGEVPEKGKKVIPIVLDDKEWTFEEQEAHADEYKDEIKRILDIKNPEAGREESIYDDKARVDLITSFDYGENVLEFGCSDGTVSLFISRNENVKTVTGIDVRKSAIKDANDLKVRVVEEGIASSHEVEKVTFMRADITQVEFSLKQFDTVCAFEVLEHIHPSQFHDIFMSLYSFVKLGGNMLITLPNRYPNSKYEKMERHRWPWPDHKNFFTELSLRVLLEPYFKSIKFYPLYPGEDHSESIYLTCVCEK